MISAGTSRPARQSRAAGRQQRRVRRRLGRAAVASVLRSRRFHERVIIVVIGLAALVHLARESKARAVARLAAWDRQRTSHDHSKTRSRPA